MIKINADVRRVLEDRWEAPRVISDIVTDDDIQFLLNEEKNCEEKRFFPKRIFGLNTRPAQERMMPRLKRFLKFPFRVTGGNYFNVGEPHIIHADTGTSPTCALYKIIVIPLCIVKDDQTNLNYNEITLSVMSQRWYNQAAFFIRGENEDVVNRKKKEYNIPIIDYDDVFLKTNKSFPMDLYDRAFDHIQYSHFENMSILETFKWRPGDILTFDRSNIHVASNFIKYGAKSKIGLTFFLEYADL